MKSREIFFVLLALFSLPSQAYEYFHNVKVTKLIQFETGIGRDYTIIEMTGAGSRCRVPHTDKELLSLMLAMYVSQREFLAICYDTIDDPGGSTIPSRRMHSIHAN